MGEWDCLELVVEDLDPVHFADDVDQLIDLHHLRDRELAHWKEEMGLEKLYLGLQPRRTILDLDSGWHSIPSGRRLARKTATDRGHVGTLAKTVLFDSYALEPAEERFSCGPSEGPADLTLVGAGCLAEEQHW